MHGFRRYVGQLHPIFSPLLSVPSAAQVHHADASKLTLERLRTQIDALRTDLLAPPSGVTPPGGSARVPCSVMSGGRSILAETAANPCGNPCDALTDHRCSHA